MKHKNKQVLSKEAKKNKNLYKICLTLFFINLYVCLCSVFLLNTSAWLFWTSLVMLITILSVTCYIYFSVSEFICPKCKKQFKPKTKEAFFAFHTTKRRRLTCPDCKKKYMCTQTFERKIKKFKYD